MTATLTSVLLTTLACVSVHAEPPAAESPSAAAAREGEAAFVDGRWDDASEAFARAYESDPRPAYLYARAQAERKAGRCPAAIELYEQFLDAGAEGDAASLARENIEQCQAHLDDPAPPTEAEPSASTPPPPESKPPTPDRAPATLDRPPPSRPWFRDPWGGTLVGLGAGSMVAGGVLFGVAQREHDRAVDAPNDATYGAHIDDAKSLNRAGIVAVSVGAALVVAGVVRWAILGARGTKASGLAWLPPPRFGFVAPRRRVD